MKPHSSRPAHLVALSCVLLAACAGGPSAPPAKAPAERTEPTGVVPPAAVESPLAGLFAPAMAAIDAGDWMRAELALPELPAGEEPDPEYLAYRALADARIADLRGDLAAVEAALAGAPRRGISRDLALGLLRFERRLARRGGDHLRSARLAQAMLDRLPAGDPAADALARSLWLDLQHLDSAALAAADRGESDAMAGWLDRLRLARGELSPAQWTARHGEHPASRLPLPPAAGTPPRIALLLPLGGRLAAAAAAVRDGFLAAYYDSRGERPSLQVMDTGRFASPAAAYRAAVEEGAGLVVGPLTKAAVAEVLAQPSLPVPVIALNRSDGPPRAGALQFALAPEDEAREVARHALAAGHRRALLLRPAGAWGDKVAAALADRWTAGGGVIAARGTFSSREDHSETVERALGLDRSAARGEALRQLLDRGLVLAGGRRRQDLDNVFMLAPSTEAAKSLKPLLAYHYAGALPVYATSAANSAVSGGDRDLAGLRLVELPWLLGSEPALRRQVDEAGLGGAGLERLQALGADAWVLARRHAGLEPGGVLLLSGATGFLTVNDAGEIERELPLATFAGGGLERD